MSAFAVAVSAAAAAVGVDLPRFTSSPLLLSL